jgi:signal transduction histidine kinase
MQDQVKLLLIDDDEIDRKTFKRYLDAFPDDSFSVLEFETGKAGLEHCSLQKPDCMLLDYNLPDLNGLEFLSKLENTSFPILMLTGQGDESVAVEAMKMGAQDYLIKDRVTPTYLMSAIKNAIRISRSEEERKRVEEELVLANDRLENRVKERTSSLEEANSKLLAAKEIAESANKAKSTFLSKMSHELRTPIHAILGFTQLLQMDQKNPLVDYQNENMERVSSAGNHLLKLINEVLDLSKVDSGKIDLNIETLDLIPIVDNVFSISQSLANEKNISLKYEEIPREGCFVEIDVLRFKQAVLNLISNAIKYNKLNGSVVVSYKKQKNGKMRLGFQDTGHGIAEDQMDKIFQPFERFDVDVDQIEGTGIGLTISKRIIETMGGTIGFESVIDEGSFFYIDVPVSDKRPTSMKIETPPDSTPASVATNRKKVVLYIEDIPANIDLVRQVLTHRPHIELLSAPNALEGIEMAKTITPDLVLMDIHLPGMNGLEAFKKLQIFEATRNIPVIALTADAMDSDAKKALDMGFYSYITKPIDVSFFLETIDKVLSQQAKLAKAQIV